MNREQHWLSRVVPRLDISPKQIVALGSLDPYGQHQVLWKLFSVPKEQCGSHGEFLFRAETCNALPAFILLSREKPVDANGLWEVVSKPYAPDIRQGDRLAFKLRANPVDLAKRERSIEELEAWRLSRQSRGLKEKPSTKKRLRHDVVMAAKLQMGWKNTLPDERPPLARVAAEAGAAWLRDRQDGLGCSIDEQSLRVDGYRTYRLIKRKGLCFSSLEFDGCLFVTDPERFRNGLLSGIGPAKGFGCGLMLVKRA
jgi:CRISPR system Cascade subunit CasE